MFLRRAFLTGVFSFLLSFLATSSTFAQGTTTCRVEVATPQAGNKVAIKTQITGSAIVPAGMHLWVFVRKSGQSNWWPQAGGSTEVPSSGSWVSDGTFGDEADKAKDSGAMFQIAAVIVDNTADAALISYVKSTLTILKYPGTAKPAPPAGGCELKNYVDVTRE